MAAVSLTSRSLLGGLVLLALASAPAAAQFDELAAKVPGTANAIVLLDGQGVMSSKLAIAEGWMARYEEAFADGLVAISPETERMLLAAQFDFEFMKPQWELAIADFKTERSAAQVARLTKGTLDPIGDTPAVVLNDHSYAVQLGPKRLAVMSPANRQTISRWLRDVARQAQPALSPYLLGTLPAAEKSQIVIAVDLQDAIPPDVVRAKLAASPALASKKIDVDAAAKALSSVRGIVLEVAVTEGSFGRLMVHFNDDASVLEPVAKPLLMEILGDMGAAIEDIEGWTVSAEPKRFSFHGELSEAGRRRVFSMIDHPTSALIAAGPTQSKPPAPESNPAAIASKAYFTAINSVLADVRRQSRNAQTFGQSAMWFDKWARRIDGLPVVNVDPDLLQFGAAVSASLRDVSSALRGIGIQSAERTAQIFQQTSTSVNVGGAPGYWGWGGSYSYYTEWRNVDGERRAVRAQERAKGATTARAIFQEIENQTVRMRQAMSSKFKIEF